MARRWSGEAVRRDGMLRWSTTALRCSYNTRVGQGVRRGRWRRTTMARGGSSPRGGWRGSASGRGGQEARGVGVLLACSLRGKRGARRKTWAGGDRHLLRVGGGGQSSGEWSVWGWRHIAGEDVGGLAWCLGGAVGRQRPNPSGSGWVAHAHVANTEHGRPESPTSGSRATVTGGAGWKRFKPFQNSNGLKTFKFF
jgi:hypothetical protein